MTSLGELLGDDDSSLVAAFYDRFPYPDDSLKDGPPPGFNWRWSVDNVFSFCTGALPRKAEDIGYWRILDAGCGSGVSTDYLAHLNPGSEILAVDISKGALAVAIERLRRSGGDKKANLRFENKSLFELGDDGKFDFINSVGVLHHLLDPDLGLKKLASLLKYRGILHLFIYAKRGRLEINNARKAMKILGLVDAKNDLKLARQFFENLPEKNSIRKDYEERWALECQSDVNFADMYLHPRELNYDLQSLWQMIDNSNLQFVNFSNPNIWFLERFFNGELLERAKKLSYKEQMLLVEYLDPQISHFEFFLSKGALEKYQWNNDDELLSTTGKLNKCIWGWPSQTLHDSEMNRIEINADCLTFLKAIEISPGIPFGLLPLNWDQSMIASTARDLQKQQLLLIYPL